MGLLDGNVQYFENKNYNAEDLIWIQSEEEKEKYFNEKMGNPTIFKMWTINKVKETIEKGANYLIIRFPVWDGYSYLNPETLDDKWIRERFDIISQLSAREFTIKTPIEIPNYLRGIFFIKPAHELLLRFLFQKQAP